MSGQSDQIDEIFLHAVEIESPNQRTAFLDRACADDGNLRREVETLIMVNDLLATVAGTYRARSQRDRKRNRIGEIPGAAETDLAVLLGSRLSRMCLIGGLAFGLFVAALFIQSPNPSFERLLFSRLPMVGVVALCGLFGW